MPHDEPYEPYDCCHTAGTPKLLAAVLRGAMATSTLHMLRVSAPAPLTGTALRRAAPLTGTALQRPAPRRATQPARAAKSRGEGAPTELAQRSRKDELVFDSAPALAAAPVGASLARQLYSEACEAAVNAQINVEVRFPRATAHAPSRSHPVNECRLLPRRCGSTQRPRLRTHRHMRPPSAPPPAPLGNAAWWR